ncbi:hypothetical protein ACTXT7_015696 [Hymenolepis weldensis]
MVERANDLVIFHSIWLLETRTKFNVNVENELCIQEVIDAEFHDISRLGVLQVGGTDHDGRRVIAFFACRLPHSDLIDHDRLLQ